MLIQSILEEFLTKWGEIDEGKGFLNTSSVASLDRYADSLEEELKTSCHTYM